MASCKDKYEVFMSTTEINMIVNNHGHPKKMKMIGSKYPIAK
jgi:hypothetical protein